MNTLRFYPKKLREQYIKNIRNAGVIKSPERYHNQIFIIAVILTVVASSIFYFFGVSIVFVPITFLFLLAFFYFNVSLKASARIRKMELVFPDVISLMASNLRSGITIDKAFLLAARPEFDPLDKEIMKTGRDISTGQDVVFAMRTMGDRIESEKIEKVVMLIISGLKAGGNISDLLEQTASNMKKKEILEKKSRSTILMYVLFIFFAVGMGAPVLFSLSSVLVDIVIQLTSQLPDLSGVGSSNVPFTFSEVSITANFVIYFAIFFMIISDLISSLVIGLVQKGDSKAGLRYFLPLVLTSTSVFFIVRRFLSGILVDLISF